MAPTPSLREKILARIKGQHIRMRPRWHFVLLSLLTALGTILLFLALLYVTSLTFFFLRATGVWFAPSFGTHGVGVLVRSLPWALIALSVLFIIVLEVLVHRFSFAYRQPLLTSVLAIMLMTVVGGALVAKTSLHRNLTRRAHDRTLPIAGHFYRDIDTMRFKRIHVGNVSTLTDHGFTLRKRNEEILDVRITPKTRFPRGINIAEGDTVVVFGERADGNIDALGVRVIEDETLLHPLPPRNGRRESPRFLFDHMR